MTIVVKRPLFTFEIAPIKERSYEALLDLPDHAIQAHDRTSASTKPLGVWVKQNLYNPKTHSADLLREQIWNALENTFTAEERFGQDGDILVKHRWNDALKLAKLMDTTRKLRSRWYGQIVPESNPSMDVVATYLPNGVRLTIGDYPKDSSRINKSLYEQDTHLTLHGNITLFGKRYRFMIWHPCVKVALVENLEWQILQWLLAEFPFLASAAGEGKSHFEIARESIHIDARYLRSNRGD